MDHQGATRMRHPAAEVSRARSSLRYRRVYHPIQGLPGSSDEPTVADSATAYRSWLPWALVRGGKRTDEGQTPAAASNAKLKPGFVKWSRHGQLGWTARCSCHPQCAADSVPGQLRLSARSRRV